MKNIPWNDIELLIHLMWNIRLDFAPTKANKYRYLYLKELCKSIINTFEEEKDYDNAAVFKDLLKDIKSYNYRKDDGRFFRDIKYNYHYLDELYELNIFQFGKENENYRLKGIM